MRNTLLGGVVLASALAAVGCSPSTTPATGDASGGAGGSVANGGSSNKSATSSKASGGNKSTTTKTSKGGNSAASEGNEGGASDGGEGSSEGGKASGGASSGSKSSGSSKGGTGGKSGSSSGSANGGSSSSGSSKGGAGGETTEGGSTSVDPTGVAVRLDKTHQTIQGFGINTALSDKNIPISTMFSTTGADGIGLSILRVGMNTDGSLTGTGISDAKKADPNVKIIGSCWSAPANCKSNNNTKDGGYLLEKCYDSWATTIAKFAKDQGLYAMSVGNESDFASCPGNPVCTDSYETMTYTGKQMAAWVKVAGKKIKEASPSTKVIAPEASEWIHVWSNLSGTGSIVSGSPDSSDPHKCGCFSNTITAEKEATCAKACLDGDGYDYGHWLWKDQDAWKSFDILGLHEYDSQVAFAWPADVNDGKRDKEVWQTEMSGVMHWPEQGPSTDIKNGLAVAGWIHSALTVGEASAWLYWWYQALYQDDNEGLALTKSGGTIAKRYYVLGNYSKFMRPGYLAVEITGNSNADLLLSGAKSSDGKTVVVVAVNKGSAKVDVPIGIAGGAAAPASCTPTVTSASDNLKDGTAVEVKDGSFAASLAAQTVTTYVCK